MHLILTGATGLVGSAALRSMLINPEVTKITIISRRPVAQAEGHEKAQVVIHKDFMNYDDLGETISDAQGCVWALGISQSQVTKSDLIKITLDYPLAFARHLVQKHPNPFNFVYVSGEGATTSPRFYTPTFGPIKGKAESSLIQLGEESASMSTYCLRPAGVDASNHPEIKSFIPTPPLMMRTANMLLLPPLKKVYPSMLSPTKELGNVLVQLAMGDGKSLSGKGIVGKEGRIIDNVGFRRLASI